MPRQRMIDRPKSIEVYLPGSVKDKVEQELYSEVEGRVPFGALSRLGVELFTNWLRERGKIL